ncbi:MAG TPA: GDYXXLXY domain-containing protein, partial [Acidimicrobiales bacterium]|nr:GDYXXLXY domain-containing protein [Acidimicrobiales bacterium]
IDPFRGAYVDLSYPDLPAASPEFDESVTEEEMKENEEEAQRLEEERGTAYVPLTRQGEVWVGGPIQRTAPADGLYLRCDDSSWRLECGIESWFLPQDEAKGLEEAVQSGEAVATVKVDGSGNAALIGITVR